MKKIVIIGPSKVGKTAIVSSLQQAVSTRALDLNGLDINVAASNEVTNQLFSSALRLIVDGFLPFAGTASVIDYAFKVAATQPVTGLMQIIHNLFGIQNTLEAEIEFPDAPGGALFEGDDEEVDHVLMKQYRKRLIGLIKECDGLIICVDISMLNGRSNKNNRYRAALEFARWIPNLLNECLFGSNSLKLDLKRVCVVLTKADLWAAQNGHTLDAEQVVKSADAYALTKELLGPIFLQTLKSKFAANADIAFCMSSVYGFLDGAPNPTFGEQAKRRDRRSEPTIDVNLWKPYNAIEPFIFLLTGQNIQNQFVIKKGQELGH